MTQTELTLPTARPHETQRHVFRSRPSYSSLLKRLRLPGDESTAPQVIGVTSCTRREGVSTVAANLAMAATDNWQGRMLLIDANFSRPSVHKTFRVERSPGLIDLVGQRVSPQECVQASAVPRVDVLTSGVERPAVSLDPGILREFLITAKYDYDWIFVDLDSAGEGDHALVPLRSLDGVLLVVEAERVRDDVAKAVCDELQSDGTTILGVVLNKVRGHIPRWLDRRV